MRIAISKVTKNISDLCSRPDALITPISVPTSCNTGDVALADGRSAMEGRVEVCRDGVWGAVYGEWNFSNARVVCRQLRFPSECEF